MANQMLGKNGVVPWGVLAHESNGFKYSLDQANLSARLLNKDSGAGIAMQS